MTGQNLAVKPLEVETRSEATATPRPKTMSRVKRVDSLYGYLFVAPVIIGFVIFVAVPLVAVFRYSLLDYNMLSGEQTFAGLDNFTALLSSPTFQTVLANTAIFALGVVPANVIGGMALAVLVNQKLPAMPLFRTLYFTPVILSLVAWSLVWQLLLRDNGGINSWLAMIGIDGPNWIASSSWALPSVMGLQVLKGLGISMILFLAALQDVPEELREAAAIDGAGRWRGFVSVSLPLVTPTIFLVALLSMINSLKTFALVYALTSGGPGYSSTILGLFVYNQAFGSLQLGLASAAAVILFIIAVGLTLFQWWARRRWVFNDS